MEIYDEIFKNFLDRPIFDKQGEIDKAMLRRTLTHSVMKKAYMMLSYKNLPEEIPERMVKIYLQGAGHFGAFWKDGVRKISWGAFAEKFDEYYFPTKYIVTNPYMEVSETFDIGNNIFIIKNDSMAEPLTDIVNKYVQMMVENETSMIICDILTRAQGILSAKDDAQMESARTYLKNLFQGKVLPIKSDSFQGENMESIPFGTAHYILTDLMEYEQYIRSSLYSELGIKLNFNMKREALNSSETSMDEEILKPYIDNMIETQQNDFDMLTEFWKLETPIKVKKGSVWADMDLQDKMQEATAEATIKAAEDGTTPQENSGKEPDGEEENADESEN